MFILGTYKKSVNFDFNYAQFRELGHITSLKKNTELRSRWSENAKMCFRHNSISSSRKIIFVIQLFPDESIKMNFVHISWLLCMANRRGSRSKNGFLRKNDEWTKQKCDSSWNHSFFRQIHIPVSSIHIERGRINRQNYWYRLGENSYWMRKTNA